MAHSVVTYVCFMLQFTHIGGSLLNSLSYYEVIHSIGLTARSRRSVDYTGDILTKELTFQAFNRSFTCHLRPRTEIFGAGFKVSVVHEDGSEEAVGFQEGNFFQGEVEGEKESEVHGYFEDGGLFTGTVLVPEELFVIEPMWRHIEDKASSQRDGGMVVYRVSDMTWQKDNHKTGKSYCGAIHANQNEPKASGDAHWETEQESSHRDKRATPTWNTCKLIAVADYKFYQSMGGGNIYTTASYIAGVIERVDALYKATVWDGTGLNGLGFEIQAMRIHDSPTTTGEGEVHYNMAKTDWDTLTLLKVFSRELGFTDYCLAHLFTYQAFANNVLGLAYIASPTLSNVGGVCSGLSSVDGVPSSLNTGFSSSRNEAGNTVLTQMADLVTAHGHNWGSEHDPDSGDCSPSSILGDGKYLMYPFSVSGSNANNYKFSSCSKVLVNRVLQSKGVSCFTERSEQQLCGNGLIDAGEDCDAGYLGKFGLDPCCSSSCRLIGQAQCSPVNHECCVNCRMANVGYVCAAENNITCQTGSRCTGDSLDCPETQPKNDGTACLDGGQCQGGRCEAYCEARNKVSCVCSEVATSCFRCCRDNSSAACQPYDSVDVLPNGRPCVQGYCGQGVCIRTVQTTVERFFSIIENLTVDAVLEFFRDNLVGAVIIFSLIVWVPVCIGIKIYDYRRKERFEEDMYRVINIDRHLVYDEDGRKEKKPILNENTPRLRELRATDLVGHSP